MDCYTHENPNQNKVFFLSSQKGDLQLPTLSRRQQLPGKLGGKSNGRFTDFRYGCTSFDMAPKAIRKAAAEKATAMFGMVAVVPVISVTSSQSKTNVGADKTDPQKVLSARSKTEIVADKTESQKVLTARSRTDFVPENIEHQKILIVESKTDVLPEKTEPQKTLSVEEDGLKQSASSTENLGPIDNDATGQSVHPKRKKKRKKDKPRVDTLEDTTQTYRDLRDADDDMIKPADLNANIHMLRKTIYVPIMDELNMPVWDSKDDEIAQQLMCEVNGDDDEDDEPGTTDGGFGSTSFRTYCGYENNSLKTSEATYCPTYDTPLDNCGECRESSPVNIRKTVEQCEAGPSPTDEEYWNRRSKTPARHDRFNNPEIRDAQRRRNNSTSQREDECRRDSQCRSSRPRVDYDPKQYRRPSITREKIEEARRILASPRDRQLGLTCDLAYSDDRRTDPGTDHHDSYGSQQNDPRKHSERDDDDRSTRRQRSRRVRRDSDSTDASFGEAAAIHRPETQIGAEPDYEVKGEGNRGAPREGLREQQRERSPEVPRERTPERSREEPHTVVDRLKPPSRHIPGKPGYHRPKKEVQNGHADPDDDTRAQSLASEYRNSDDVTTKTADGHHKVLVGRDKKVHHTHREYEQQINFGEKPPDLEHFRTSKEPAIRRKKNKHARKDHRDTQTSGITLVWESNHDMVKYQNKYENRPKYKEGKEPQPGDLDYVDPADGMMTGNGAQFQERSSFKNGAVSQESIQSIPSYDELDDPAAPKPDARLVIPPSGSRPNPARTNDKPFDHRDSAGNYIQKPRENTMDKTPAKTPYKQKDRESGDSFSSKKKPPREDTRKESAEPPRRKSDSALPKKLNTEPADADQPGRPSRGHPCYRKPTDGCQAAFSALDCPPSARQIAQESKDPRLEVYQPDVCYTAVELRILITRVIRRMENRHRLKSRLRTELAIAMQEQERQVALTDDLVNRYNSLTDTYENLKKRKCELDSASSPKRFEEMRCHFQALKQRLVTEVERRDNAIDTVMRTTDQTLCLFEKTAQNVEDQWLQELTYLRGENAVLDAEYYRTQAAIRQLETDTKKAAEKTKLVLNKLPPPCPVPVCLPLNNCPTTTRVLYEARRDRALYYDQVLSLRQQFERAVDSRKAKTFTHLQQFEQQLVGVSKGLQHVLKRLATITCDMTPVLTHPVVGCFVASARSMRMDVVEDTVMRSRQENQQLSEATENCRRESDDQKELAYGLTDSSHREYALLPKYRRALAKEEGRGEGCPVKYT